MKISKLKGIYLASFVANHEKHDLVYQDINGKRDIDGDMMDVDLAPYDFVIATPPCNYYSRANWRRESSEYSQATKHLLPEILKKLVKLNKPFLVENVINKKLMQEFLDLAPFRYEIGRHTYWSNVELKPAEIVQHEETKIAYTPRSKRQGGKNVYEVVEHFISRVYQLN